LSRTFEALQRLEKEQQVTSRPVEVTPIIHPGNGAGSNGASSNASVNGAKSVKVGEEEVLKLVQRVFRSTNPDAPRTVAFSGVDHGDGCSWITANAALTLAAQTSSSICVVDANFRTPSLHRFFDIENRFGLVDAIAQSAPIRDFAQQLSGSNLWVLTCGSTSGKMAANALSSEALRARMTELRSEFDYVLIDTPPANLYADCLTLGRLADGTILVLQSNASRREAALKAKESFENAHVRLLGAVLNKRTFPIPQNLYNWL